MPGDTAAESEAPAQLGSALHLDSGPCLGGLRVLGSGDISPVAMVISIFRIHIALLQCILPRKSSIRPWRAIDR